MYLPILDYNNGGGVVCDYYSMVVINDDFDVPEMQNKRKSWLAKGKKTNHKAWESIILPHMYSLRQRSKLSPPS